MSFRTSFNCKIQHVDIQQFYNPCFEQSRFADWLFAIMPGERCVINDVSFDPEVVSRTDSGYIAPHAPFLLSVSRAKRTWLRRILEEEIDRFLRNSSEIYATTRTTNRNARLWSLTCSISVARNYFEAKREKMRRIGKPSSPHVAGFFLPVAVNVRGLHMTSVTWRWRYWNRQFRQSHFMFEELENLVGTRESCKRRSNVIEWKGDERILRVKAE